VRVGGGTQKMAEERLWGIVSSGIVVEGARVTYVVVYCNSLQN
jgi:hypothetical protein